MHEEKSELPYYEKINTLATVKLSYWNLLGIWLIFADNGSGIDTAWHKDRLFGMYQRFHSNSEGHGLGLFIVKAQVQALGGNIEIESKVGSYTRFIITLPATNA